MKNKLDSTQVQVTNNYPDNFARGNFLGASSRRAMELIEMSLPLKGFTSSTAAQNANDKLLDLMSLEEIQYI